MVDKNKDMNSDNARAFIREVNDEMYEAKVVNFWMKNSIFVFLFVVFVILGTAGYETFSYFKKKTSQPPITEKQLRIMYEQMGMRPNEAKIQQVLRSMGITPQSQQKKDQNKSNNSKKNKNK